MKVKIKSWTMAAYWTWDVKEDDLCGICHNAYDACCPQCSMPGDDCSLVWGQCSHVFHLHCIEQWLASQTNGGTCPMDRKTWSTVSAAT
ncbi:anaphase-promoting complex subunit Apc11 [Absidia repens]|uniref:Anaphase-promoting complex subunit 11 n=1 Tax=Absidia repens TaxID=90262 RepID=A0A1X2IQ45_9FUNG|nr:anaphase-promoting complex subunit Apc11 [Absidia repens]